MIERLDLGLELVDAEFGLLLMLAHELVLVLKLFEKGGFLAVPLTCGFGVGVGVGGVGL